MITKRQKIKGIIEVFVLGICIMLIVLYFFLYKIPSPQKIFSKSQSSVVELKSQTGTDIITYGSAVFIKDDGTLVSNAHMVVYKKAGTYQEFEMYEIRFSYETEYRSVFLIKYDLQQDIAILKLNDVSNTQFKAIKTRNSSKLVSGDKVYAVGNGLNHGIGITEGAISLPQINIEYEDTIRNVIQCDLIINEGNSGGALLDERGRLIGITTFRLKDNMGNIIYGVAFCIPINMVIDYLNQE